MKKTITLFIIFLIFILICIAADGSSEDYDCSAGRHKETVISYFAPTDTTDGNVTYECELCGFEYSEVLFSTNHLWSEWVIDKEPAPGESGLRHRVCTRAGAHTEYEEIPALEIGEPVTVQENTMDSHENRCQDNLPELNAGTNKVAEFIIISDFMASAYFLWQAGWCVLTGSKVLCRYKTLKRAFDRKAIRLESENYYDFT